MSYTQTYYNNATYMSKESNSSHRWFTYPHSTVNTWANMHIINSLKGGVMLAPRVSKRGVIGVGRGGGGGGGGGGCWGGWSPPNIFLEGAEPPPNILGLILVKHIIINSSPKCLKTLHSVSPPNIYASHTSQLCTCCGKISPSHLATTQFSSRAPRLTLTGPQQRSWWQHGGCTITTQCTLT